MSAVTIKNLSKTYRGGVEALKNVDLTIEKGDFFALLGANGAGKTTLIGILTGLVNKTSGKVNVLGYDIDDDPGKTKSFIGVVPQEFNFNMFEKVQDIIVTQGGYFGVARKKALAESEFLLEKLGLYDKRNVTSRSLSGGMKRRLMIARALVHKPQLLILDEPTAGVDVELRHGMWEYLRELNESGVTILLTTHYLEEVEQMCEHAAIIKEGAIIKNDKVKNFMQLMDTETYIISVAERKPLSGVKGYHCVFADEQTIEVQVSPGQTLNDFIIQLVQQGVVVRDIRPQGFRLEKLFLNLLKK